MTHYAKWLICQRALKIAIDKHGWDSEEAEAARRELDAVYKEMKDAL